MPCGRRWSGPCYQVWQRLRSQGIPETSALAHLGTQTHLCVATPRLQALSCSVCVRGTVGEGPGSVQLPRRSTDCLQVHQPCRALPLQVPLACVCIRCMAFHVRHCCAAFMICSAYCASAVVPVLCKQVMGSLGLGLCLAAGAGSPQLRSLWVKSPKGNAIQIPVKHGRIDVSGTGGSAAPKLGSYWALCLPVAYVELYSKTM